MTAYVVRHITDRRFWAGDDRWSPHPSDALVFEFETIALGRACIHSNVGPSEFEIQAVHVPDDVRFVNGVAA
jgi:hypothetical protein